MAHPLARTPVFIAGVAETPLGKVTDQSEFSMVALAAREALAEAGLKMRDVDALFTNYMGEEGSVQLGEYLGIEPRYAESSDMGGASFEFFVHHAMAAVATGRCDVALIGYASRQRSRRNRKTSASSLDGSLSAQFETPFGIHLPIGHYALSAARYMHQYDIQLEHLAEIAVTARQWAALNPKAWIRDPLSIEDVMASPMRPVDCSTAWAITGFITLSSNWPCEAAKVTAVWLPITCVATMVSASACVGFTLPGMIDEPGSFSGSESSPRPERGPDASRRISLAIL